MSSDSLPRSQMLLSVPGAGVEVIQFLLPDAPGKFSAQVRYVGIDAIKMSGQFGLSRPIGSEALYLDWQYDQPRTLLTDTFPSPGFAR